MNKLRHYGPLIALVFVLIFYAILYVAIMGWWEGPLIWCLVILIFLLLRSDYLDWKARRQERQP